MTPLLKTFIIEIIHMKHVLFISVNDKKYLTAEKLQKAYIYGINTGD